MPLSLVRPGQFDGKTFAREFARRHGRRVKQRNVLTADGVVPVFTVSVRKRGNLTLRITCGARSVTGRIDRSLPTGMACSIGTALPNSAFESRYRAGKQDEFPVFITDNNSERVPEFLASPALLSALEECNLGPAEYLQISPGIGFQFLEPSQDRVEVAFAAIQRVASAFERAPRETLPDRFPAPLRPISSLVIEWGVLDAGTRADRIADAHPDALRRLLGSARRYALKIEKYLTNTRYHDSEGAQMVRAFAAAVALAEIRMEGVQPLRSRALQRKTPPL